MGRRAGLPVVPLDEFYRDADDPGLPRRFGIVDWDDPASWRREDALEALLRLARHGHSEIPEYSIPRSRREGTRLLDATGAPLIVAEGIFAAELLEPLRESGLLADALVLNRPVPLVFGLRLARDLREGRKSVPTLLRRGWALAREQHQDILHWRAAGMRPVRLREGERSLHRLAALAGPAVLRIVAVCFVRSGPDGAWELLSVRKRDTSTFMQVGGKIEPGETAAEAATREVLEELGELVEPERWEPLLDAVAPAANEPDTLVDATVLLAPPDSLPRQVQVRAEIEEARWLRVDVEPEVPIAPLMRDRILPALRRSLH
ncbi:NUDIX domain-containing protein [Brachybacterium sp. EF45031]|nr:NUDIX domain-containing protein [Brachybacterium sillae]